MLRRSKNDRRRRTRSTVRTFPTVERLEARQLLANGLSEFAVNTAASQPLYLTAGSDGNTWFTEYSSGKIGKMAPNGTVLAEYSLASAGPGTHHPYGITAGPDGNLWFTDPVIVNGQTVTAAIGRISTSGTVQEFALPSGSAPHGIAPGPDGNLWFAENGTSKLGRITPGGSITEIPLSASSHPESVAVGPDKMLWVTETTTNRIARVSPSTLSITEFAVPTANSVPWGITASTDGNMYFSESGVGKVGRITTSGSITEIGLPNSGSRPVGIAGDAYGNIWVAEYGCNRVAEICPDNSIMEYLTPTSNSRPNGLIVQSDNAVWSTEVVGNRIFRVAGETGSRRSSCQTQSPAAPRPWGLSAGTWSARTETTRPWSIS